MKMHFYFVLLVICFKIKFVEAPQYHNLWVVWNVGQGQWITHILPDECRHYDIGGEFGSFSSMKKTLLLNCGNKINIMNLSHWDYDHFLNIPLLARSVPKLCWQNFPKFGTTKKSVQKILDLRLPRCVNLTEQPLAWTPFIAKDTNESSNIFFSEKVLISGDSPIQQEKIWLNEIEKISTARVLILGHHGSRTSTSKELLTALPNLEFSIASARYLKYKHPHKETLARLSEFQIPVLKTEDWGNIWFR